MTSARPTYCPRCGQKVSPTVGECFFCDPDPDGVGATVVRQAEEFGQLLFEAEEMLARGLGDKALVLASRAVKDRPDNLTALAVYERARRDVLKGRRREKLEARIARGRALFAEGRFAEAERIVNSALKLLPDHALAQQLHAMLKERRLATGTVEAEAERELDRLAHSQAQRAAQAARAALANGWYRRALVEVRRGLRLCPDDPELLAVMREIQHSDEEIERESARRRAVLSRVRVAQDLLARGRLEESLAILRAVLREEPDDPRAQAAVQDVRRAWLERHAPAIPERGAPDHVEAAPVAAPAAARPQAAPGRAALPRAAPAERAHPAAPAPRAPSIPPQILLPRTRRRATPVLLAVGGGALAVAALALLVRSGSPPPLRAPAPRALAATPAPAPEGPLDGVSADLRAAIEATLADYARALETRDPELLARSRPDLTAAERASRLAPFEGALNVATDLRVLQVAAGDDVASVPVLRTDVIVGGSSSHTTPEEEVLRFTRRASGWALDGARR